MKRSKKKTKKAVGEGQPAAPAAETVPTGKYLSSRNEEELVNYEPEEPAAFSPVEDDLSVQECYTPAHGDGPANISTHSGDSPVYLAKGSNVARRKRSQNCFEERWTSGAPLCRRPSAGSNQFRCRK
jgi:hypothetical protein